MPILHKGDKIGFIAPSCSKQDKDLTSAIEYFENLGLKVVLAKNLNDEYRYLAGTDKKRAKEINNMFKNKDIKALFCIRGGAGSTRTLNLLDYNIIKSNPKPIIGLSDSTSIQNAIFSKTKTPSLTGFLPLYDFKDTCIDDLTSSSLKSALFEDSHKIISGTSLINGKTNGKIIGGCLSSFNYLCGTQYLPDFKDKILLLEDVGEKTYKIDLMLNQLKQQKNFDKLKGIIIGQFSNCTISAPEDGTIEDCIKDFTSNLKIPIIKDFQYGHIPSRHILPIGINVEMVSSKKECSISW